MAGNTVELVLAGDSRSLDKAFDSAGKSALDAAADFDKASGNARTFGGAMDSAGEAAGNSEGKFMGAADLLDGLGGAFGLPTEKATGMFRAFGDLSGGFEAVQPLVTGVLAKLGLMTGATAAQTAATGAATGAQTGLNMAMLANPIGIVIAGLVSLIAIGYVVVRNWDTIKAAFVGAFDWVKDHWPLLLAILTGPFGLAVLAVVKFKDDILGFIGAIPGAVTGALSTLAGALSAPFRAAFDGIKSLWNSTVGGFGFKTPEFGIGPLHTPSIEIRIPKMHMGGVVPGAMGTEVPIMAMAGETVNRPGEGGTVVNITVQGNVLDGRDLGRLAQSALLEREGRTGNLGIRGAA